MDHMLGQVGQSTSLMEVDDPRLAGKQTFTQSAADYGGFGPTWGRMRIEDDDDAWVGDLSGVWHAGSSDLSGWLVGEGAYQGLLQYIDFETTGVAVEFSGAIYPAEAPPLELEIPLTDSVASNARDAGLRSESTGPALHGRCWSHAGAAPRRDT